MNTEQALFRRHAESKGKAIVAGATMDIEPIASTCPKPVVRNFDAEEPQEGPRSAQAQEAHLAAVRVTGEHQITFTLG